MKKTLYTVFYMKPESFRRFNFGQEFPTRNELCLTHVQVSHVKAKDMEDVFCQMQSENMTSSNLVRNTIRSEGLQHTSMSVGDVVFDNRTLKHFVVAPCGFKEIN
jgi:hypothetical protein